MYNPLMIFTGAALATMALNNKIAERRAGQVVNAVQQYKTRYGHYPQRLAEVAPEFLPSIPRTKYTLSSADFIYIRREESPLLWYVVFPPFGRRVYDFNSGKWGSLD